MTTLAWDGRYLAADRRHQSGSVPHYDACKIVPDPTRDGSFYASTGPMAWTAAWIAWDTRGADPHGMLPISGLEGHQGGLVRLRDGKCEMLDFRLPYWTTAGPRWSFGSGADFALAAMACDRNSMEAVEIAARFDTCTGGGVDFVDLEAPEKGVQRWDGVMPSTKFPMPHREGPSAAIWRDCEPAMTTARWPGYPNGD